MTLTALLWLASCTSAPPATDPAPAIDPVPAVNAPAPLPPPVGLGRPATPEEIAAWDRDVDPTGRGLPDGRGDVPTGRALYAERCAACHGPAGEGTPIAPAVVGREPTTGFADDWKLVRTIGNWWPHATTVFDYVQRAMPQTAPGSLTPDETYALTAFLLAENGAVTADFVADRTTLPQVVMPTKITFVDDDRGETTSFR